MNIDYDQLFSIDTSNKGIRNNQTEQYYPYEATPYPHLKTLFSACPLKATDHLVDVGAGKGRLLFYAHDQFECQVTGIEMNEELYHLARKNKAKYFKSFSGKSRSIHLVNERAENYAIETMDNIFYFFNPFSLHVFKKIVKNITISAQQHPRMIELILYYPAPEFEQYLQKETSFKLLKTINIPGISKINPRECFVVYSFVL